MRGTTLLKYVATIKAGQSPSSEYVFPYEGDLPFLQGNAEFGEETPFPELQCAQPPRICNKGDILVSVRAPVGSINWADRAFGVGRGLCAITPVRVHSRFLWWWLHAQVEILNSIAVGTTYPAVTASDLAMLEIPRISMREQRRIADFLDVETSRMDEILTLRRQQKALLQRSEIDYLTQLMGNPSRGGSKVCRALIKVCRKVSAEDEVVTAYRDGVVTSRSNRRVDGYTMSDTEFGYQGVLEGDIVFHALDGFAGAVGVADSSGKCSPVYHVCSATPGNEPQYVALAIRAMGLAGFLETQAPNVRQRSVDFRKWENLGRVPIALPAHDTQVQISDEFRRRQSLSRTSQGLIEKQLTFLAERRQALITASVTGQIDVTAARSGVDG